MRPIENRIGVEKQSEHHESQRPPQNMHRQLSLRRAFFKAAPQGQRNGGADAKQECRRDHVNQVAALPFGVRQPGIFPIPCAGRQVQ